MNKLGYYIHGNTPGGTSDQNLKVLNNAMRNESYGNVRGRGLVTQDQT